MIHLPTVTCRGRLVTVSIIGILLVPFGVTLGQEAPLVNPDFVTLAGAYGIRGIRVTGRAGVAAAVAEAAAHDGPVLLDIRVESDDAVYPMVAAGAGLDQMIRRPAQEAVR